MSLRSRRWNRLDQRAPEADRSTVEEAFDERFQEGYEALAVVEYPDLSVPFALSSWDAVQRCGDVDPEATGAFIETRYAPDTTFEGFLACAGRAARQLPACEKF